LPKVVRTLEPEEAREREQAKPYTTRAAAKDGDETPSHRKRARIAQEKKLRETGPGQHKSPKRTRDSTSRYLGRKRPRARPVEEREVGEAEPASETENQVEGAFGRSVDSSKIISQLTICNFTAPSFQADWRTVELPIVTQGGPCIPISGYPRVWSSVCTFSIFSAPLAMTLNSML
jgi:hypothetical protein